MGCVSACVYTRCLLFSKRPASSLASQDKIIRHSEAQSGIIFSHQSLVSCQFEFYSGLGCDASIISLSGGEGHRDRATHFIHLTSTPNGQHLRRFCRNGGHIPAQGSPSAERRGWKKHEKIKETLIDLCNWGGVWEENVSVMDKKRFMARDTVLKENVPFRWNAFHIVTLFWGQQKCVLWKSRL